MDNADWIEGLNYVEFLRDIGRCFSVNRMLSFEAYKLRMEKGLSFIEFNYQLLQAYDFLMLYQKYGCRLQMGGDDQWGNIVSGTDLIRRVESKEAYGLTFPLLTTASGAKMGKNRQGRRLARCRDDVPVRLLPVLGSTPTTATSSASSASSPSCPWRKCADSVPSKAPTFARPNKSSPTKPPSSVTAKRPPTPPNPAPKPPSQGQATSRICPATNISKARIESGLRAADLFVETGLCESKGQAVKLFRGGGGFINDRAFKDHNEVITLDDFTDGEAMLRSGKKKRHRLILED